MLESWTLSASEWFRKLVQIRIKRVPRAWERTARDRINDNFDHEILRHNRTVLTLLAYFFSNLQTYTPSNHEI